MQPNEQTPPQLPPDPNTPSVHPIRRTIIQPLSSEDEIRQAAASTGAPVLPLKSDIDSASVDYSDVTLTAPTERESTSEDELIAEPVRQFNQNPLQYNIPQSPYPNSTAKIKKPFVKVFVVMLSMLIIGVLGVIAWLYFFNRVPANNLVHESVNLLDRESPADLVMESYDNSTYLRPKEWLLISDSSSGGSGYANAKAGDEQLTALISISEFSEDSYMNAASEAEYARVRKFYMETIPDNIISAAITMNAPMGCEAGTFTVARSENATKTKTTIGIADIVVSCKKDGGSITKKMRAVTGLSDGRSRMIVVAATELEWRKNEKIFQQMLDSVEERKAT